jgi:phosphotransferase system  glucose/maltose/N-acetylglucosamine-specific IIC component
MDDLLEKLKSISWIRIIKSLSFDGGASSTKWVYLACAAVVNACLVLMVAAICWEYIRTGQVNITLAALIGATITTVVAIPANSANQRRQLNSQQATGQPDTTTATTPLTTQVSSTEPQANA